MSSMFDGETYLAHSDPDVSYTIKRVSGGVVNVVLRAVKTDPTAKRGRFPDRGAIILKYAPPFIAGVGEEAPMSTYRQTIEARALSLFTTDDTKSLRSITEASQVSVPELLHHDAQNDVLIISDLGKLPNFSDIFNDLGGYTPGNPASPESSPFNNDRSSPPNTAYFSKIGARLGSFFLHLHSSSTLSAIDSSIPDAKAHFSNPSSSALVLEHAIKPVGPQLKLFPSLLSAEEADRLLSLLVSNFQHLSTTDEGFVLGDCWTGAVLVSPPPTSSSAYDDVKVGVIDWEFAQIGHPLSGDIAQFLAHLELLRISARQSSQFSSHLNAVEALITTFIAAYVPHSSWSAATSTTMKSILLAHGAEIINCAFWKSWVCLLPSCPSTHTPGIDVHQCTLINHMVSTGLEFLRLAARIGRGIGMIGDKPVRDNVALQGTALMRLLLKH